jgi:hypothetical protein
VMYGDVLLRTTCLFESLALWLEIMRVVHSASMVFVSGRVYGPGEHAALDRERGTPLRSIAFGDEGMRRGSSFNLESLPRLTAARVSIECLCSVPRMGMRLFTTKGIAMTCSIERVCPAAQTRKNTESVDSSDTSARLIVHGEDDNRMVLHL